MVCLLDRLWWWADDSNVHQLPIPHSHTLSHQILFDVVYFAVDVKKYMPVGSLLILRLRQGEEASLSFMIAWYSVAS